MNADEIYYRDTRNVPFAVRLSALARRRICDRFMATMRPNETTTVLDVGVSEEDTSPDANMLARRYPWPERMTCVGIHSGTAFQRVFPQMRYVAIEPGEPLPFDSGTFDIVYSNAVIEHVGGQTEQEAFLRELLRVGCRIFVVAPNRWFPIEHHTGLPFVHWLPHPLFRRFLIPTRYAYWTDERNLSFSSRASLADRFPAGTDPTALLAGVGIGPWRSNIILHT